MNSSFKIKLREVLLLTLVILAAGMGSRFGGLKQLTPLTKEGEFIIDLTVYDAIHAGFDKIVFIIKEENLELFEETIGNRLKRNGINYAYAFQTNELPAGFTAPKERTKPWGTAHAVLCAKDAVHENFGVVNADDFYGRDAFIKLYRHLVSAHDGTRASYCMVGYYLRNTLSENGSVSRGICSVENGKLIRVVENKKLTRRKDGTVINTFDDGSVSEIDENTIVSMNCMGFTPSFLDSLGDMFEASLRENADNMAKFEFFLPSAVQKLIDDKKADVSVINTTALWHGITYREDSAAFTAFIEKQKAAGEYPESLWK